MTSPRCGWPLTLLLAVLFPIAAPAAQKDAQAVQIAERMMVAMGGREALDAQRLLRFDIVFEEDGVVTATYRHWWDRETGRYRLEGVEAGEDFRVLFNVGDRTGRAWKAGRLLHGEEAAAMLERAYRRYAEDSYWLLMPWTWLDPGVELRHEGEHEAGGRIYDVVELSFEAGARPAPGDRYWAYVSRDSGRMEGCEHVPQKADGTPGDEAPRHFAWLEWKDAGGGVMFSTRKESVRADGGRYAMSFPLLELSAEAPDAVFQPILRPAAQAPPAEARGRTPEEAGVQEVLVVLNKSEHTAALVETTGFEVLRTIPTGMGPHEGAVSPDGRTLYVTNYGTRDPGNTLTVIDVPKGKVLRTVDLGEHRRPHGIAIGPDGSPWVTAEESKSVLKLNRSSLAVERVYPTDQEVTHMIVLSPDGKRIYTANIGSGSVTVIDAESGNSRSIPTGKGAEGIDITPDGREVWIANREDDTVSILDTRTLTVQAQLPTCDFPIRVKMTPDGGRALVSCAQSNQLQVFDRPGRVELARVPLFQVRMPIGIVIAPDGNTAFVAAAQSDMVVGVDLDALMMRSGFFTGGEPDGMTWAAW